MTRLKSEWISGIAPGIEECQEYLQDKTGRTFKSLLGDEKWPATPSKVAVVPITQGQGLIGGFSESVAAVIRVMGVEAFVTEATDVAGIYEASLKNAEVLYMADDARFIALNLKTGKIADNNTATATGYVHLLEAIAGGLNGKEVLILGYGIIGQEALHVLQMKEARVTVYDRDVEKQKILSQSRIDILDSVDEIKKFPFVLDATNTGEWISPGMLHEDVWYVSPGVPLSLDEDACAYYNNRVIHDYLQVGVAAMLKMAMEGGEDNEQ